MRILGIDPGVSLIGYGLIEKTNSGWRSLVADTWLAPSNRLFSEKAVQVYDFFNQLIKKYQPDQAALEKIFFFKNAKTVVAVSEMRGILILALQKNGIPFREFTPLQVKQAITSYGKADKKQIQKMVALILNLKKIPLLDDTTDALAIALCCAHTISF